MSCLIVHHNTLLKKAFVAYYSMIQKHMTIILMEIV